MCCVRFFKFIDFFSDAVYVDLKYNDAHFLDEIFAGMIYYAGNP